jgi:hypothetical protein
MMIPNGLELKYESARYPKPPPTIRAATSSTPIRAAIERPFRNASGSSAIKIDSACGFRSREVLAERRSYRPVKNRAPSKQNR